MIRSGAEMLISSLKLALAERGTMGLDRWCEKTSQRIARQGQKLYGKVNQTQKFCLGNNNLC
ncbi:MAG: hypothetical protein DDT29_02220 [Dehalococcoidia bacterium]|nr:hypothetical protein [Bacillota bacterium]